MPLLQRKHTIAAPLHSLPISLCAANGAAIHTFPADLISSIRHLENTLTYNNTLPKCLAVVAALSGEGVTYMSIALATTLANDRQASVCVAELNWYTPGMITRLSQPAPARPPRHKRPADALADSESFDGGPGLAGVLTQSCTLDQALVATATPNLYLLPAGDLPQHLRPALARGTAAVRTFRYARARHPGRSANQRCCGVGIARPGLLPGHPPGCHARLTRSRRTR
jgi:hypothetical protein